MEHLYREISVSAVHTLAEAAEQLGDRTAAPPTEPRCRGKHQIYRWFNNMLLACAGFEPVT